MAKEKETSNEAIAASFSQLRAEDHKSDPQLHKRKSQNISTLPKFQVISPELQWQLSWMTHNAVAS
jgi:hypothetical protein